MSQFDAFINAEIAHFPAKKHDSFLSADAAHFPPHNYDSTYNVDLLHAAPLPAPTTTKYSNEVLADTPALYLKCQEESGTLLADSSGNGRNGTLSASGVKLRSASEYTAPDGLGYHLTLDGNGGHIVLPTDNWLTANTTGFSVEMWLRVKEYKNNSKIFDFSNGTTNDLWSGFSSTPRMLTHIAGSNHTSPNYPALDEWHHYAFTCSSTGMMNTYIDGALHSSATLGTIQASARQFKYIGRSNLTTSTNFLSASVSHIAVYNKVLTPERVTAHVRAAGTATDDLYNLTFSDRPWGYWPLNEDAGSTNFIDHSPIPTRNLTLNGTLTEYNTLGPRDGAKGITFPSSNITFLSSTAVPTTQAYTAEAWVKIPSLPSANSSIMSTSANNTGTNNAEFGLWLSTNGRVNFSVYTTSWTTITSSAALALGTWHHVVATYSPTGEMTLRINKSTVATGTKAPLTAPYTRVLRVHAGYNHSGGVLSLSNIAFYKGALPTAATDAHYDATIFYDVGGTQLTGITLQPFANGLTGYWKRPLAGTSFEYRIDGGAPIELPTPDPYFTDTNIPNGTHTFEVRVKAGETTSDWSNPRTYTSQQSQSFLREIFKDSPTMYVPLDSTNGTYESWPRGFKWEASPGVTRTRTPITRNSTYSASGSGTNGLAYLTRGPETTPEQTMEAWIRLPGSGEVSGTILAAGSGSGVTWHLTLGSGRELHFARAVGSTSNATIKTGYIFAQSNVSVNYHVALRRIDNTAYIFVNGQMVYAENTSTATTAQNNTYRIGARFSDTSAPLSSRVHVDSVAFYDYALSPARLLEHSRSGHQLTTQSNNEAYPLNEGAFFIHDIHPAAAYTDISLDNGATYLTPSYVDIVKEDHPALYYRLTDQSGTTATDLSDSPVHATYTGSYSLRQPGAFNPALPDDNYSLYVPGSGGVILPHASFPSYANSQTNNGYWFTAEAWIKPDDTSGIQTIMGKAEYHVASTGTTRSWSLYMDEGVLTGLINSGSGTPHVFRAPSSMAIPAGEWTHVVLANDRSRAVIFINGVIAAVYRASMSASSATSAPFRIGHNSDSSRDFRGHIQDVAFYTYALTIEQAIRHHVAGRRAKYYGWAKISGLTNDTPVSIRARVANSYMNPPALSALVETTPSSDRFVTTVDRFDGFPRTAPGHPPYGLGPWILESYSIPLEIDGSGTTAYSSSTNNNFAYTKGTANFDIQVELTHATTHPDRASGLVARYVSISNILYYFHTSTHSTLRQGAIDAFQFDEIVGDRDVLRFASRGTALYMLRNGKLVATFEDSTYSTVPSFLNGNHYHGMRFNGADPDKYTSYIAYNKPADDEEFTSTQIGDDAYLYKGRISRVLDEPTYEP